MVKLVGAVRNFRVNIKHVQIDVEDGLKLRFCQAAASSAKLAAATVWLGLNQGE